MALDKPSADVLTALHWCTMYLQRNRAHENAKS